MPQGILFVFCPLSLQYDFAYFHNLPFMYTKFILILFSNFFFRFEHLIFLCLPLSLN